MASPNRYKMELLETLLSGTTMRVGLLDTSAAFTFDPDTHSFVGDLPIGTQEPADASYARQTLGTVTFAQDNVDDEGVMDAADVTFPSLSTTNDIQAIFIYQRVGVDDTTPLDDLVLAVYDDTSAGSLVDLPLATNGSDVTITFSTEGVLNVT